MTDVISIDPQAELSATRAECQMLLTQIEEAALLRNPRPIGRRGMRNPLTGMRLPARCFRKLPKAANGNDILELM